MTGRDWHSRRQCESRTPALHLRGREVFRFFISINLTDIQNNMAIRVSSVFSSELFSPVISCMKITVSITNHHSPLTTHHDNDLSPRFPLEDADLTVSSAALDRLCLVFSSPDRISFVKKDDIILYIITEEKE